MKKPSIWQLLNPFWLSEEKWRAWGILSLVIGANFAIVYINVQLNSWNNVFLTALQKKDWHAFISQLGIFTLLAFSFIALATFRIFFRQMLEIRWRRWITHDFVASWLKDNAFYWVQREHSTDNPDQRISEDLEAVVRLTLALSVDLLSTVVTLISFVIILWGLSGPLTFTLFHHTIMVPGYMVWAAAAYALVGSFFIQFFGKPLTAINYQQQRYEADFRFLLVRLRENSEQVAFYQGAQAEEAQLQGSFGKIRQNWSRIMEYTKRLTIVSSTYSQVANIFPILVASPRYFSGAMTLGTLFQISNAFGQVSDSLSWFISNYSTLANWRATTSRLREFKGALAFSPTGGGLTNETAGAALQLQNVRLNRPDGRPLTEVGSWQIEPGSRWLIRGPSGTGKSTLMRAMAALWTSGAGTITQPDRRQLFLPQKSYLPIGTLRAILCYPSTAESFSEEACRAALQACRLSLYAERLDEAADWSQFLSPGEQQRVAIARALLQKPDFLFLDEATSALDRETEQALYQTLLEQLPGTAVISVAHREEVSALHVSVIDLVPAR